jgi:hypothetical protein
MQRDVGAALQLNSTERRSAARAVLECSFVHHAAAVASKRSHKR